MTPEEFNDKYRIFLRMTREGVETFLSAGPGNKRYLVHVFPLEQPRPSEAQGALLKGAADAVVEVVDVNGRTVVVTGEIEGFTDFPSWLEGLSPEEPQSDAPANIGEFTRSFGGSELPVPPEAPAPDPEPTAAPSPPAGDFTRAFVSGVEPPSTMDSVPEDPTPAAATPSAPPPDPAAPVDAGPADPISEPSAPGPGEFTRMFVQGTDEAPQADPDPAPVSQPKQVDPAEFNRMFEAVAAEREPPSPAPPADSPPSGPGEFTRMFDAPDAPDAPEPPSDVPEPPPAVPDPPPAVSDAPPAVSDAPPQQPGEFTRMFDGQVSTPQEPSPVSSTPPATPDAVPVAPTPVPEPSGPGEFTRMFDAPASTPSAESPASPTPAAPEVGPADPPTGPEPSGPGEFTRMFDSPPSHEARRPDARVLDALSARPQPEPPAPGPTPTPAPVDPEKTQFFSRPEKSPPAEPAHEPLSPDLPSVTARPPQTPPVAATPLRDRLLDDGPTGTPSLSSSLPEYPPSPIDPPRSDRPTGGSLRERLGGAEEHEDAGPVPLGAAEPRPELRGGFMDRLRDDEPAPLFDEPPQRIDPTPVPAFQDDSPSPYSQVIRPQPVDPLPPEPIQIPPKQEVRAGPSDRALWIYFGVGALALIVFLAIVFWPASP